MLCFELAGQTQAHTLVCCRPLRSARLERSVLLDEGSCYSIRVNSFSFLRHEKLEEGKTAKCQAEVRDSSIEVKCLATSGRSSEIRSSLCFTRSCHWLHIGVKIYLTVLHHSSWALSLSSYDFSWSPPRMPSWSCLGHPLPSMLLSSLLEKYGKSRTFAFPHCQQHYCNLAVYQHGTTYTDNPYD